MFTQPRTQSIYQQLLAYQGQDNVIPDITSLIWFGDGVPNSVERPYLDNIFLHKQLNPEVTVNLYISKKLFSKAEDYQALTVLCQDKGITLMDITEHCQSFLNYDIIDELLSDPRDYVRASDFLRLSIQFANGGRYFDCDFTPIKSYDKSHPALGFYQYLPFPLKGISGFFSYHASTPKHIVFLYAATISRHLHLSLPDDQKPGWLYSSSVLVRQQAAASLSGNPLTYLFRFTSLRDLFSYEINDHIGYPLKNIVNLNEDGVSCLDSYSNKTNATQAEFNLMRKQQLQLQSYNKLMFMLLNEDLILKKTKEFFPRVKPVIPAQTSSATLSLARR